MCHDQMRSLRSYNTAGLEFHKQHLFYVLQAVSKCAELSSVKVREKSLVKAVRLGAER